MPAPDPIALTVEQALGKCATSAAHAAPLGWQATLTDGVTLDVSLVADDGWLLIDAPWKNGPGPRDDGAGRLWERMRNCAGIPGPAKLALPWGPGSSQRIRAEVPLEGNTLPVGLVLRALESCRALACRLAGKDGDVSAAATWASATPAEPGLSLPDLCKAAGWSFTERVSGRISVALDVREGAYSALLERREGAGPSLRVTLTPRERIGDVSREALATMLLRASALVRMARPGIEEAGPPAAQTAVTWEADLGPDETGSTGPRLDHALSALSVACRLCGREARVLLNERVAREYLTARGRSSCPGVTSPRSKEGDG